MLRKKKRSIDSVKFVFALILTTQVFNTWSCQFLPDSTANFHQRFPPHKLVAFPEPFDAGDTIQLQIMVKSETANPNATSFGLSIPGGTYWDQSSDDPSKFTWLPDSNFLAQSNRYALMMYGFLSSEADTSFSAEMRYNIVPARNGGYVFREDSSEIILDTILNRM